jgi:SAM-dependent methyltransferase
MTGPVIDDPAYARRLSAAVAPRSGWRRLLDPQRPYRWNLRRLGLGRTLDVGCGVGRHLAHRDQGSVGVDPNPHSVAVARAAGLDAVSPDELATRFPEPAGEFDSMLVAHVLEHLTPGDARELLVRHLPFVRPGGTVVAICPQARGQRSDPTHVTYLDRDRLRALLADAGVEVLSVGSFPLPRWCGEWFTHNETVVVGRRAT